jgi:hypothetical protein
VEDFVKRQTAQEEEDPEEALTSTLMETNMGGPRSEAVHLPASWSGGRLFVRLAVLVF